MTLIGRRERVELTWSAELCMNVDLVMAAEDKKSAHIAPPLERLELTPSPELCANVESVMVAESELPMLITPAWGRGARGRKA